MHSILRTANVIGLAAASASPAAANVANQDSPACNRWISNATASSSTNSIRRASQAAARKVADAARAGNHDMRKKFAAIRALPDGWDGASSVTPAPQVVAHAASVLEYAMSNLRSLKSPTIVPVADGGVQAEWYSLEHRFEIYFDANGDVSAWSVNRKSGIEMEAEGRDAIQMLVQWTSRMNAELVIA